MGKRRKNRRPAGGAPESPPVAPPPPRSTDAARRVLQFRFSLDLVDRNFDELVGFLDYVTAAPTLVTILPLDERWRRHEAFTEIMYLLHNYLASAFSLIENARVLHRHLYEPVGLIPEYESEVQRRFAADPLSQFVVKLRQMAQHYRLPVVGSSWSMQGPTTGGTVELRVLLQVDQLRQFDGFTGPARVYLDSAGKEIDVRQLVRDYHAHVMEFYAWLRARQRQIHGRAPDWYEQHIRHGAEPRTGVLMAQIAENLGELEKRPPESMTYQDLEDALGPGLTILDSRRLMLCRYHPEAWLRSAFRSIERTFGPQPELKARAFSLVNRSTD